MDKMTQRIVWDDELVFLNIGRDQTIYIKKGWHVNCPILMIINLGLIIKSNGVCLST